MNIGMLFALSFQLARGLPFLLVGSRIDPQFLNLVVALEGGIAALGVGSEI